MTITIDLAQFLTHVASIITLVSGVVGFSYFIKKWWKKPLPKEPVEPGE